MNPNENPPLTLDFRSFALARALTDTLCASLLEFRALVELLERKNVVTVSEFRQLRTEMSSKTVNRFAEKTYQQMLDRMREIVSENPSAGTIN